MLNPAEPPLIMRDTVLGLVGDARPTDRRVRPRAQVTAAVEAMVKTVAEYVPGYRLKQAGAGPPGRPATSRCTPSSASTTRPRAPDRQVSVFLEVEGAAHYLPAYAGNLDIMTSAALRVGERTRPAAEQAAR